MRSLFLFLSLCLSFPVPGQTGWKREAAHIDPENYYGVTLANGIIGLVSSAEPMHVQDVILNGVYDTHKGSRVSSMLRGFNHLNLDLDVDGQRINQHNVSNFKQVLDMKSATLTSTFDLGNKVSVSYSIMALRHLPYTAMATVEIVAKKNIVVTPKSIITAPSHLNEIQNYYSVIDRPHAMIPLLTSVGKSPSGKHTVAASNSIIFSEPHGEEPKLIHEEWDYNMHLLKFSKRLKAGETYRFSVVASTTSTKDYENALSEVERLTIFAKLEGSARLLQQHVAEWDKLWQSDVAIEGDAAIQSDVRFALYHLYSFSRAGTSNSLAPMGLSGMGFNGHIFWDAELWMYPPLLVLHPDLAKSMLEYRFQRLNAAKQNAFAHGYKGAMFPWESANSGSEETPVWALTGPFQHHVTGCVGWAFWKYYQVTQDRDWLRDRGFPVLKEVADFWASRVDRKGIGQYEINNVIGANEYQENIDNNAFTNGMAITVLHYATQAANELGIVADPDWVKVAQNIPIIKFQDGTIRENESYNGEVIKQADVNLLSYPLNIIKEDSRIKENLMYYEPRMDKNGPAMGNSILSILYSRLQDPQKAFELFLKGYKPNELPPFGVLAETAGGRNPYFTTGAGGMLQAMIFGFGGLQITDDGIIQGKTVLPKGFKNIEFIGLGINEKNFQVD